MVVEPFAGAAGYSTYFAPAKVLLCDIDPVIVGVWRYLIAATPREILALPDLTHREQIIDDLPLPQEARWLIGFWANRGSAAPAKVPSPWQIKYQVPGVGGQLVWSQRARERIARDIEHIRHWQVQQVSWENCPTPVGATFYVDPPYMVKGSRYVHGASGIDFAALGQWCRRLPGQTIVCEQQGADWLPFEPLATIKSTRGKSAEAVWTARTCSRLT